MSGNELFKAYRQAGRQAVVPPVKLIQMLFDRGIAHLDEAERGAMANDPKRRGENLSKVIAIVSELNVSLDHKKGGESAEFLASLYEAILLELPKVALNNDIAIIRQARSYLKRLKDIWEETAMREEREEKGAVKAAGEAKENSSQGGRGERNLRVANLSVSI